MANLTAVREVGGGVRKWISSEHQHYLSDCGLWKKIAYHILIYSHFVLSLHSVMYPAYAKWIKSHRDLPLKLNQWNNVVVCRRTCF